MQLWCDRLALDTQDQLMAASLTGPHTAVVAFAAAFTANNMKASRLDLRDVPLENTRHCTRQAVRFEGGYRIKRHRLAYSVWQVFAVARCERLLLSLSNDALYERLKQSDYTTPILPEWTAYVAAQLMERGSLIALPGFGLSPGWLSASDADLDEVVSAGLQSGALCITEAA